MVLNESNCQRRARERKEAEAKSIQDKKNKELAEKNEKMRLRKLIIPYMEKLDKQLTEKKYYSFFVFPDRKGFTKIQASTVEKMQKILNENTDKYKNRKIAKFNMRPFYKEKIGSEYEKYGIMLSVTITIYNIDKNGVIILKDNSGNYSYKFSWEYEDFKISKFSFKLLDRILKYVATKDLINYNIVGIPLSMVIEELEEIDVDISDVLSPLAGAKD